MEFLAGYHYRARLGLPSLPPLVLLHGSGGSENAWGDVAETIAFGGSVFTLRGPIAWQDGFAFFRRNPDRTLDYDDLAVQTERLAIFLEALSQRHALSRPPVVIGFSNGAIITASLIARQDSLTSGAVLMRALSPFKDRKPAMRGNYPLLILAAQHDTRREPRDREIVVSDFMAAGADVTHRLLDCGHAISSEDLIATKGWLEQNFA
jgi:phospholipase/carboxylesterase